MIRLAAGRWCLERDRLQVELKPRPPARRLQDRLDPAERSGWVIRDLFEPDDPAR